MKLRPSWLVALTIGAVWALPQAGMAQNFWERDFRCSDWSTVTPEGRPVNGSEVWGLQPGRYVGWRFDLEGGQGSFIFRRPSDHAVVPVLVFEKLDRTYAFVTLKGLGAEFESASGGKRVVDTGWLSRRNLEDGTISQRGYRLPCCSTRSGLARCPGAAPGDESADEEVYERPGDDRHGRRDGWYGPGGGGTIGELPNVESETDETAPRGGGDGTEPLTDLTNGGEDGGDRPTAGGGSLAEIIAGDGTPAGDGTGGSLTGPIKDSEGRAGGEGPTLPPGTAFEGGSEGTGSPGEETIARRDDDAVPAGPSKVCEIAPAGADPTVARRRAGGFPIGTTAQLAARRNDERYARAYEFDTTTLDVFDIPQFAKFDLTDSAGRVVPFIALRRARREELSNKSEIEIQPVIIEGMGKPITLTGEADPSLPVMNIMVFGAGSEIAYSGLAALEAGMKDLASSYRLNIEYHRLTPENTLAAPVSFPSFRALIDATPPLDDTQPFVILSGNGFLSLLDKIAGRIAETSLDQIDHVFLVKGPFSLPPETPVAFGRFLDRANGIAKLPHIGGKAKKWITVISAQNADLSNVYLEQPLKDRIGTGTIYVERDARTAGKRQFLPNPGQLGAKLNNALALKIRLAGGEIAYTSLPEDLVLNGMEVFVSTGMLLTPDTLATLAEQSRTMGSVLTMGDSGAKVIENWPDALSLPEPKRLGIMDIFARSSDLALLRSKYMNPKWMVDPIAGMNGTELANARRNFNRFAAVLAGAKTAIDGAVGVACDFVYLPLARDYTAVGQRP